MVDARDFREALARIRRNLQAGHLTPTRLGADLAICDQVIAEIVEAVEPEFEVDASGIHYAGRPRPARGKPALTVIDGGRS
jgi:hypothetical protein